MSRPLSASLAAIVLAIAPSLAKADVVYFTGNGGNATNPVSYSGSISVTPGSGTTATVQVSLTNTTSIGGAVNYGWITGFGFNVPGSTTVAAGSASSSDTDFKFLTKSANTTSLQAGEFSYAWSTSSSVLHTVTDSEVTKGIASVNATTPGATTTFTVTLNNAAGLTAAAIASATAPAGAPFSVRFRSSNDYKYPGTNSDGEKVPFSITPPSPPPPGAVPAPAGLLLGLIGAGCFIGRNLRRKIAVKN